VPPAVSPLFLALVVIIVVLVQSQRVRTLAKGLWRGPGSRPGSGTRTGAEVAS
jgi:galactofuranose transport system permease protein